ncbi:MAG: hypothetical protein VZR36_08965 [Prevotella sp.]|nr:hypothetical protein [Prevotella sp.]
MEYYIQGNEERAEEIKAAFEAKGVDTASNSFTNNYYLYYSSNGLVYIEEFYDSLLNVFKSNPHYKELELELTVKPMFKVGDWIVGNEGILKITQYEDEHGYDLTDTTGCVFHFVSPDYVESNFHLWSIEDAKDGDVLANTYCPFIYRKTSYNNDLAYYYAGIDYTGNFTHNEPLYHFGPVKNAVPATREQCDLLFAKMQEAGYQWDVDKKELRKIKPHQDIANFKPFDKVLVRDDDNECWMPSLFGWFDSGLQDGKFVCETSDWYQCIPFEGNEHLLGTTDMCDEMYVNW